MHAPRSAVPPPKIQRKCGCAASAGGDCGCGKQKVQRKRRNHDVSEPGDPLELEADRAAAEIVRGSAPAASFERERPFFESHFGHDFSRVRVHDDPSSHAAAAGYDARAFTQGNDIYFGHGELAGSGGRSLLAHELAHVMQQRTVQQSGHAETPAVMRQTRPARPARVDQDQRDRLMGIYNRPGSSTSALSDAAGFRTEMADRVNGVIDEMLINARARQSSTIDLSRADVQSLGTIAWREIVARFGPYLQASATAMTPTALQAELTRRVHLVSETQSNAPRIACNLVVNLMDSRGEDIIDAHHVVSDSFSAKTRGCAGTALPTPLPADQRDQALYESVRDAILTARATDLRLIAEFGPSFSEGEESWIQTRLIQQPGQSQDDAIRRGRWITLGTTLHELLHTVAHSSFRTAFQGVDRTDVGIEGFAEFFAREVFDDLRQRASSDDALRMSIESRGTSFDANLAPERRNYAQYIGFVDQIRDILNHNDENLRAAYFSGRTEFLGLGNWSLPANQIGFGVYLTTDQPTAAFFRAHYGRVLLGNTGRFQFHLGGDVTFLTQGTRLGVGPDLSLQYSWPNVFIAGGASPQVTADVTRPLGQTIRLDVLPHMEAGVRIGAARVGVNGLLLIPTPAAAPGADRNLHFMLGLGASGEF
jgi:hypothetical protein